MTSKETSGIILATSKTESSHCHGTCCLV
jgi:hypothetical protein